MMLIGLWILNWGCAAVNGYIFVRYGDTRSAFVALFNFSVGTGCIWVYLN